MQTARVGAGQIRVMLEHELQRIYDSEINVPISWLWDGGIDVRLGDEINGYPAEENFLSMADIVPWLQEAIAHFYPDSTYAKSLDPQIRERAVRRLFRPPTSGAQVICPELWRTLCSSDLHGRGILVRLLALRQGRRTASAQAMLSIAQA